MAYDFSSLSPADFEDLSRDVIGKEIGVRFEAFAAGPDGGIDGRHSKGGKTIILQAKHYGGSRFSDLKRVMKRERHSIDSLLPDRYILSTSFKLTEKNKAALAKEIGPTLQGYGDIFGSADLNSILRAYPEIVKSHFKLWLSSTAMLERVLRVCLTTCLWFSVVIHAYDVDRREPRPDGQNREEDETVSERPDR